VVAGDDDVAGVVSVAVTVAQVSTIGHIAAIVGDGEVRSGETEAVWFRTARQDWLIRGDGSVLGWNDVPESEA
jgi:hypothetical protein